MNYRLLSRYLGFFVFAVGTLMLPSVLWALYFFLAEGDSAESGALVAFLLSMACAAIVGAALVLIGRSAPDRMYQREALSLVSLSWIVAAGIGALPFIFSGVLGPVDAYFESMSGFTTTGSTVITDIEAQPKSILFWRSFTQWIGGMGIVVLFIAVLPYLGAGGKQLFRSESPGPDPRGLSPHIKDTASILYKIYLGLTAVQTVALMLAGMNFYEALTHTLSTLATGGFSTRQASLAGFDSAAVESIVLFFMLCAGTNFVLFFMMLRKEWKAPFRDTEWRVYIGIILIGTALIAINLMFSGGGQGEATQEYGVGTSLRHAAFQVVSMLTTTGFTTDDFNVWPAFSRMLLVGLMFVGACAGSTGGGMKIVRLMMLVKMAYWRLECTFRPKTIRAVRIGGHVVGDDVQKMVYAFLVLYIMWFAGGTLFMSALGLPFETATTSVIATLNNIGPGLGLVGATGDYADIPDVGKIFLSLCMVLGRLELFSVCVLFVPSFWRHS